MLATQEAAATAMVHGQQGSAVTVSARQEESGDFAVEVSNLGGWEELTPGNGHGLEMVMELMRDVEIETKVQMRSR